MVISDGAYMVPRGTLPDQAYGPASIFYRDDRGNIWKGQQPYGYPLPTYCGDSDHTWTRNKPGKIAQVFVIPASAVPHLTGIQVEAQPKYRRYLITL